MSESNKGYWSSQEVWVNFAEGEMIELTSEEKGINSEEEEWIGTRMQAPFV